MFPTSSYQSPESHLMRDRLAPARLSVVAAAIGYGLGALAKSIPQWKTSLANPCNSLHVSHCHSRPLDDVQKYWHTSLQFGNMCANLTGD